MLVHLTSDDWISWGGQPPTIHADVDTKETALTYRMLHVIMGIVQGMGFPINVKPVAWAADFADMFTR
jgi:predicted RNase H-related nuclease YkuK (DUF458 family)